MVIKAGTVALKMLHKVLACVLITFSWYAMLTISLVFVINFLVLLRVNDPFCIQIYFFFIKHHEIILKAVTCQVYIEGKGLL